MKRESRHVAEAAYPIFFGFRNMLASHLFEPTWSLLRTLKIEEFGIEHLVSGNLAV